MNHVFQNIKSDAADAILYALQVIQGNLNMSTTCYVFYGIQLYGTYPHFYNIPIMDIPDGCYIYQPSARLNHYWYQKALTTVLIEDVPKVLRTLCLLMGI